MCLLEKNVEQKSMETWKISAGYREPRQKEEAEKLSKTYLGSGKVH